MKFDSLDAAAAATKKCPIKRQVVFSLGTCFEKKFKLFVSG